MAIEPKHTAEDVKAKAAEMELVQVDFLDERGNVAGKLGKMHSVRFGFIDGTILHVPESEWDDLEAVEFKLRPSRNDA